MPKFDFINFYLDLIIYNQFEDNVLKILLLIVFCLKNYVVGMHEL